MKSIATKTAAIIIILCGIFRCQNAEAATSPAFIDNYNVSYITIQNGLATNHLDDIYKDSDGFLWISFTGGGLSRYDGHNFINFSPNSSRYHIKSGFVRNVTEDRFHRLWVATESGLEIIDLPTLGKACLNGTDSLLKAMDRCLIHSVTCDATGCIWISSGSGLSRVAFDHNGFISSVAHLDTGNATHLGTTVRDIDRNGMVWFGAGNTVCRVTVHPDGTLQASPVSEHLRQLPEVDYFSDFVIKESEVWISTNRGLYRYDTVKDMAKCYLHIPGDPSSLSQNFLTDIAVTKDKQLIISTLRGINIYNPMKDNFERVDESMNIFNNCFINMMLTDGDRIFIATEGGGINMLRPRLLRFSSFTHSATDNASLSPNPVNAITFGSDGSLFVGTVEGGLNRQLPDNDRFIHYTMDDGVLSHNSVSALATDSHDRLWVGTWGGGIDVLDSRNPTVVHNRIHTLDGTDSKISYIGSIIYDNYNDGMWIGCNNGLLFFDCTNGVMTSGIDTANTGHLFGFIGAAIDRDNQLWQGCADGLFIIDLKRRNPDGTFPFRHLRYKLDEPESDTVERVSCIHEASDGTIWIGSSGYGLYRRVMENGVEHFINYNTEHGLASNTIKGILEDLAGNIWVSTVNGLSCLLRNENRFTNYTCDDGLPGDQFYWNAACRSNDGRLLFGSTCGLLSIIPETTVRHTIIPEVVFTRLFVGNQPIIPPHSKITDKDIAHAGHIRIHESDRSLSVEFAALDYERHKGATYSYMMKGFDKDWITVDNSRRFATYTNLSPGDYTLLVKYSPDGTAAASAPAELHITVESYFYRTPWFFLLVTVIVLSAIFAVYRFRIKDLTLQKQRLKAEVDKRTSQLTEQKSIAENRAAELSDRNRILTEQNEEINRQKQQLTEMNLRVKEMTIDSISFFTNITHEFRTPITLIIGPIERALKLSTNPQVIEQLHFVERNSKYLLSLVNQLMDFRKIESGKIEISKSPGNFNRFINELIDPFTQLASDRNINIRRILRLYRHDFVYDEEALRKVLINLISNAIKFTPDGGTITVYAATLKPADTGSDNAGSLYLCVSDTGNGINEEDTHKIFDRFYQGSSEIKYPLAGTAGSGIGLYLCRSIVELYGGSISVRNNHTAGCSFRVRLPIPAFHSAQPDTTVSAPQQPITDSASDPESPATILVVEDNADMRSFIRSILLDRYNVIEASNGAEAIRILMEQNVDFIISDLMMPVMDGVELSRRVKENFAISHIPFLMLTAKTANASRIDSYRIGVDDYLLKPFDEEVLLARIEGILRNRRRMQHNFSKEMDIDVLDIANESRDKKFIDQVMEVAKSNYRNSYFEVGDFAEALGISRSLLNKKLQSLIGQSAGQFIRTYRMNVAKELILKNRVTKAMNISEIAYEVGFNDSKYFTRCFTRQFNVTPSSMLNGDTNIQ